MSRKIKIIFNPASRGGKSIKIKDEAINLLDKQQFEYDIVETKKPLEAINMASDAKNEGYDMVVALGGDGTVHEVANGAIKGNIPLGIIPAGSGNDFSKAIGLDGSLEQSIETLANGNISNISTVKIGDRYSINVADAGLGADVAKLSMSTLKWLKGSIKYTLLMIRKLMTHKPYKCVIKVDEEAIEVDLNILAVGFGQSFGSGMLILPDARYSDEEMTIAIIKNAARFTILRLFPKIFSGKHVNYKKYVTMLKGKKLEIIPKSKDINIEADGEVIDNFIKIFEAVPHNLQVSIPSNFGLDQKSLWNK